MHNLKLILTALATALVAVHGQDDIGQNDFPSQCQSQCQNVLNQSQNCENQYGDPDNNNGNDNDNDDNNNNINNNNQNNSQQYRDCFCNAQNIATDLQNCANCVNQNRNSNNNNNNDDNDGPGNGGDFDNDDYDVQNWLNTCQQNGQNPSSTYSSISGTITSGPTGTQSCQTSYYTLTVNGQDPNNNNNNNNNNDNSYTTTTSSVYCGPGAGIGSVTGSYQTSTYTSVFNDQNGNQQTSTYTSLVGTGANGQQTTLPTNANTGAATFDGAGAAVTALPFAGAGAAFMIAAFAL